MSIIFIYKKASVLPWSHFWDVPPYSDSNSSEPAHPTAVVAEQSHQGIPGGPVLLAEEPKQRSTSASHCWKTSPDRCQDSMGGIAV